MGHFFLSFSIKIFCTSKPISNFSLHCWQVLQTIRGFNSNQNQKRNQTDQSMTILLGLLINERCFKEKQIFINSLIKDWFGPNPHIITLNGTYSWFGECFTDFVLLFMKALECDEVNLPIHKVLDHFSTFFMEVQKPVFGKGDKLHHIFLNAFKHYDILFMNNINISLRSKFMTTLSYSYLHRNFTFLPCRSIPLSHFECFVSLFAHIATRLLQLWTFPVILSLEIYQETPSKTAWLSSLRYQYSWVIL